MGHKGLLLHLEQSSEHMILYRAHAVAIFSPCHPTYGVLLYSMIYSTRGFAAELIAFVIT